MDIPEKALQEWKNDAMQVVETIYQTYKNDPYMVSKINHYICKQLPIILENIKNTHLQNQQRIDEISQEQDQFIQNFLNRNRFFHIPLTEKYFIYNGVNYLETTEDTIIYYILQSIRQEQNPKLLSWKDKTKISLLKRIKETHLTKTIPESDTIQRVLDILYPSIFLSKNEAKYFLVILGDNLLRKNQNHIYFISPFLKNILREWNQISHSCFGVQCIQTFKFKCHEKHYEDDNAYCRILRTQENLKIDHVYYNIDLLCVACHYSNRYGNADEYIRNHCNTPEITQHALMLTTTTPEELVDQFISEYLFILDTNERTDMQENQSILVMNHDKLIWQNMLYLWKQFLHAHQLPITLFQNILKMNLIHRFPERYVPDGDYFIGIGSSQWPMIQTFLKFWTETMEEDDCEFELEMEEISSLFRYWGESVRTYKWEAFSLSEIQILDVISYFFPDIEIGKQKYVYRIRCNLWDKGMDIHVALEQLRDIQNTVPTANNPRVHTPSLISIYDAYEFYCKFYSTPNSSTSTNMNMTTKTKNFLVSKSYFEKFIMENYSDIISENGILSFV